MGTEKRQRSEGLYQCRRERLCHGKPKWRVFELVGDQLVKVLHVQLGEDLERAI